METNNPSLIDLIMKEMTRKIDHFDFRRKVEVIELLPPVVLGASDEDSPEQECCQWNGYHLSFFPAEDNSPKSGAIAGTPSAIFEFISSTPEDAFFDFPPLGQVLFSKNPPESQNLPRSGKLEAWINYALSPELWGPQGKWMRFHQRLHTLFAHNLLLNGKDFPGFYPVKADACDWEALSIKGDLKGNTLELTIPWAFPLSALEKLEHKIKER